MAHTFKQVISSTEALTELMGTPSELAVKKQLAALDHHMTAFIAKSPFVLVATTGRDGRCDVSPRGDAAGFVYILDDQTLILPERSGNRRVDSLRNIVETGAVGLIFLVPGTVETLRVNGRAQVIRDEDVLAPLTVQGKQPLVGIAVSVEECFLQCGRAVLRSQLWVNSNGAGPSFGQILKDHAKLDNVTVESLDEHIQKAYKALY